MAEISADLIYEVLKAMQRDMSLIKGDIGEVKASLNALRGHQVSMQQDVNNIYGMLARYDDRLERIERRLELHDAPALI